VRFLPATSFSWNCTNSDGDWLCVSAAASSSSAVAAVDDGVVRSVRVPERDARSAAARARSLASLFL